MAANPMSQFDVYRIGPEIKVGAFDISFTNASLFMILSTISILLIFNIGSKKNSILPNKVQLLAELSYTFVAKMISDTAGSKAKPYFAFIFSLFMFVLFCNMFGMIPYTFTVTSHIIVTHHAFTMSKMKRLYGVTMPQKGISQLVAVDLQKAESMVA